MLNETYILNHFHYDTNIYKHLWMTKRHCAFMRNHRYRELILKYLISLNHSINKATHSYTNLPRN